MGSPTQEIAQRKAAFFERQVGWHCVLRNPPPVNRFVLTKIDDELEGARNVDTEVEYVPWAGYPWYAPDGKPIQYEPTHWRYKLGETNQSADFTHVAHKAQGGTWPDVQRMAATPDHLGAPIPEGMILRLSPEKAADFKKLMDGGARGPIMLVDDEPIAIFGTADYAPNFDVKLCTRETRNKTVYEMIWSSDDFGTQSAHQSCRMAALYETVESLDGDGNDALNEYGLEQVCGLEAIVEGLVTRAKLIAEDRDTESSERASALQLAGLWRDKYCNLAKMLVDMLSPEGLVQIHATAARAARERG